MDDTARHTAGMAVRRRVLGSAYVDRQIEHTDEFTGALQDLVVRYCWGEVWQRPELSPATRSLITVAMLTALDRPDELRIHVQGALNNGCSQDEIRETLLQTAIYCGVPAALAANRVAKDVLRGQAPAPGDTPSS